MHRRYLHIFLWISFVVLSPIGLLNVLVDPSGIYWQKPTSPNAYASAMRESRYGLLWPGTFVPERNLAKALIAYADTVDCVVIGSSHVMQISSERPNSSLSGLCPSLLNLGVSGASIEDHLTLSYLVVQSGYKGTIVLGVAPWALGYGADSRWHDYANDYLAAERAILGRNRTSSVLVEKSAFVAKINNLFNLDYAERSLTLLEAYWEKGLPKIEAVDDIDFRHGEEDPVRLRDGSILSSTGVLQPDSNQGITVDIAASHDYKMAFGGASADGIRDYKTLLKWIVRAGAKPILLLTPYHPYAWERKNTQIYRAMTKTETLVRDIGRELNIDVYGSYNPKTLGCSPNEFVDVHHAKDICLAKIQTR